jgi:hypothetical protein
MAKSPDKPKTLEDQKRDEVLARMLNTPAKPHTPKPKRPAKKSQAK